MERRLPFSQQLKRERELRGWSQADIASKLNVEVKTISRWESGRRLPRPYHRQELCILFNKNAEELGLIKSENVESRALPPRPLLQEDWGEAPHISSFHGRDVELSTLKKWIVDDRCRLVALIGVGGIGKTTLSTTLAEQVKDEFGYVLWRSLQNAPPLAQILKQSIQFFSNQEHFDLPNEIDDQISLLIHYFRIQSCLLILDNAESILQAQRPVGLYREGYEGYGKLIQRIGEVQHASCLLLTSREKAHEISRLEGTISPVRSLTLSGIGYADGRELLKDRGLFGPDEHWVALVDLYSGNPLALKLVSEYVAGIFGGDITRFLREKETAFGDVKELLDQQFRRLSTHEQEILYWLAIEREAVSLDTIRENFVRPVSGGVLLEALDSLQRRSLIEMKGPAQFTLQPVIMEYITNMLTMQAGVEFATTMGGVWTYYAFMKAQAKDYIRESQRRLILAPVAEHLLGTLGKKSTKQKVLSLLSVQRQEGLQHNGYLAGNALNLLIYLGEDLHGADFSSLTIRQPYLQNVALPEINFTRASFVAPVFTTTFGNILSVTFSPQGGLLATGTATGDIWIHQSLDGTPLFIFHGHTDGVWSLAFRSDEHILLSSSDDQTIRLWDVRTGTCLDTLHEHANRVRTVAFSPDNTLFASGSDDRTVRLWDTRTCNSLKTLYGHADRVWSVSFNPDGTLLASGSTDGTIRLWEVSTGRCLKTLYGHVQGIRSIAFSPDGRILVSGGDDQTVRLWDVHTGRCLKTLVGHTNRVWSVAFNPTGTIFASGGEDQTIRLWDVHSYQCSRVMQNHTHGVRAVAFNPDDRTLASGGDDQTLRLWDVVSGYSLRMLQGYTNRIWSIAFSPHARMLVSGSEDQMIRLWDVQTERCLYTLRDHTHGVRAVAFRPGGHAFASGGEDQTIRIWETKTGRCLHTLRGHNNWIWSICFSPDDRTLASGSEDQTVRLWDLETGHCLHTLQGHTSWVRTVAFSPDSQTLASGSDDKSIRLWNAEAGRSLSILQGHTNRVRSVVFSPDGQLLASSSEDQTIRIWEVGTGHCFFTLQGHTNWVRCVVFSPDGLTLASGGEDQSIRIWDIRTGQCLYTLYAHTSRVRSLVYSPDGHIFASGSDDGMIKLWDTSTRRLLTTLMSERPYERMNITSVRGLTEAQKATLKLLGAVEDEGWTTK